MEHMQLIWLGIFIVLIIVEICTLGLTTIWFAGGALLAFFAAMIGFSWPVQIVLFLVVSLVLLIFTRPVALKYFNAKRAKTNSDSFIGKTGVVKQTINNDLGEGQVMFNGIEWTARSFNDKKIAEGKTVVVTAIDGVKLIVKEEN